MLLQPGFVYELIVYEFVYVYSVWLIYIVYVYVYELSEGRDTYSSHFD